MRPSKFTHCIPAICAALMLTACGGESSDEPAATDAPSAVHAPNPLSSPLAPLSQHPVSAQQQTRIANSGETFLLKQPEANARTMQGFSNLGSTCYANSALKFLVHSIGTKPLLQHLNARADAGDAGDAPQREAAWSFVQLIENSYSETAPSPQELENFFASLQKLPAFSSLNDAGMLNFPLVGRQQDANEFLMKLSQAFELRTLYTDGLVLQDAANAFKTSEEYATILQPASASDTLQEILDRTQPSAWQFKLRGKTRYLTVRMENAVNGAQVSNRNFNFNQTVQLQVSMADGKGTTTLTLEPREVVEFRGNDNAGHYLVYVKDEQWFRHDDAQVTALDRMPSMDNALLINFAITKAESRYSSVQ